MREDVHVMLQVQEIDQEILELESRRREIPLRRAELQRDEKALRAEAEAVRERLKALLLEGRQRETEMRTQEDQATRYQGQLAGVTTNKEYVTLLSEIKGVREKVSVAEDRAIAILEETEQLRARGMELEAAIQRAREASEDERGKLDAHEAELVDELAVRADRRSILSSRVGAALLSKYGSFLRKGRLPALVALRGRACGNCFGTLPLQAASEIRRQDQPYTCEHCGVILYVPEPEGSPV
ncbi:MAG: zinc ribbon domain-containing protein [Gemmatimonadota bacterium]